MYVHYIVWCTRARNPCRRKGYVFFPSIFVFSIFIVAVTMETFEVVIVYNYGECTVCVYGLKMTAHGFLLRKNVVEFHARRFSIISLLIYSRFYRKLIWTLGLCLELQPVQMERCKREEKEAIIWVAARSLQTDVRPTQTQQVWVWVASKNKNMIACHIVLRMLIWAQIVSGKKNEIRQK